MPVHPLTHLWLLSKYRVELSSFDRHHMAYKAKYTYYQALYRKSLPTSTLRKAFPGGTLVKNSPANAGDTVLTPGSGRVPGEGNSNLLQYSCLENPMDRGAWRATVHGVIKSWTPLSTHGIPHKERQSNDINKVKGTVISKSRDVGI